jgi:N-acetylneuraminate synthase|tara:strand:+ start:229637 stop:230698 length:1062 start_codon:yes stop_codon:yes gene_type:complete
MKKIIEIDGKKIGEGQPPYVIAEMSGNHNGDINRAKALITVAKDAGADAVKLQTYTADSLTINSKRDEFTLKEGTWAGRNLYELYQEAHTPWDWFPELFAFAKELGITIFSSPFDQAAIDLLENLNAPAYKIASNELTDWPLVEAVVKTGKPIIVSTGAATKQDVMETVDFIKNLGGESLIVLHCVSAYPAPAKDTNLGTMLDIRDSFDVLYGLSDHTLGTATSVAAVSLGACMIEKHYTLDRNDGGPDSSFSLEPTELKSLCHDTKWAWESLGGIQYGGETNLKKKGIFTRQFWAIEDIEQGESLSLDNIKSIRAPADSKGIRTKEYKAVIGKKAKIKIPRHSPVTHETIER